MLECVHMYVLCAFRHMTGGHASTSTFLCTCRHVRTHIRRAYLGPIVHTHTHIHKYEYTTSGSQNTIDPIEKYLTRLYVSFFQSVDPKPLLVATINPTRLRMLSPES